MYRCLQRTLRQRSSVVLILLCALLVVLSGCGSGSSAVASAAPATRQVLTFPNVGITDPAVLDPALGPDANSQMVVNMLYSGLVRLDKANNAVADQASSWLISTDQKVYTFTLRSDVKFSDGTPVTAQSYVYSWTRALMPDLGSPAAMADEQMIVGADAVNSGKSHTLSGVRALNDHMLQVTLKQSVPYFLTLLSRPTFFPVNQKLIAKYGEKNWSQMVVGNAVGTGPFVVQQWEHNIKMVFVPNPNYYGRKLRLSAVNMYFMNDAKIAFETYRASQSDIVWDITSDDMGSAAATKGFVSAPQQTTDALFFDNEAKPFDNLNVRRAFAYALDKVSLAYALYHNNTLASSSAANSLLPPAVAGYQAHYAGLPYDRLKARALLQAVYPDPNGVPPITFSYSSSDIGLHEAVVIQQLLVSTLNIPINMHAIEPNAYNSLLQQHKIQFGFVRLHANYGDPAGMLSNLLSTSSQNPGRWSNTDFDQTMQQAAMASASDRASLYHQADQIAVSDVGILPLNYPLQTAIISPKVRGVTINSNGLYFGDWGDVYMSA